MAKTTLEIVREVAKDYDIPEWVWRPIMGMESGGNPKSWNNPDKNGNKEDSRGLFQINIMAHPQWKHLNLFDPEVNARIAFPNFLQPAWNKVKGDSGKTAPEKTAFVWRYGIRPAWNDSKNKAIQDATIKLMTNATDTVTGATPSLPTITLDTKDKILGALDNFKKAIKDALAAGYKPDAQGKITIPVDAPFIGGNSFLQDLAIGAMLGTDYNQPGNINPSSFEPEKLIIIPASGIFPEISIKKSTLFTTVLWIIGIIAVLAFVFMIAKGSPVIPIISKEGSENPT